MRFRRAAAVVASLAALPLLVGCSVESDPVGPPTIEAPAAQGELSIKPPRWYLGSCTDLWECPSSRPNCELTPSGQFCYEDECGGDSGCASPSICILDSVSWVGHCQLSCLFDANCAPNEHCRARDYSGRKTCGR